MYGLASMPVVSGVPTCSAFQVIGLDGKCQTTAGSIAAAVSGLPGRALESVAPSFFAGDAMGMKRLAVDTAGWSVFFYFLFSGGSSRRYGR